jgi:hypothetical protein
MKIFISALFSFFLILFLLQTSYDFVRNLKRNIGLLKNRISEKDYYNLLKDLFFYGFLYYMSVNYLWEKWIKNN